MVELQRIETGEAKKMLGVYLAPNGKDTKQVEVMKEKTKTLGDLIRTGHVKKNEAWTALTLMAMKSIEYPLSSLTLSEKECTEIMCPLLKNFLPKAGVNRNFKRDMVYASLEKQGLGIKNPYITQGVAIITDCIEHLWKESITGYFIKTSLEHLRLEIGVNKEIMEEEFELYKDIILTESWIKETWRFASEQGIKWKDGTKTIEKQRQGDRIIMEDILSLPISKMEKKQVNRCRMYLRAFTLADITSGNGKKSQRTHGQCKEKLTEVGTYNGLNGRNHHPMK